MHYFFHQENFNIGITAKDKLNVCRITLMTCHKRRLLLNVIFPKWGHGHQWWQCNAIICEEFHRKYFMNIITLSISYRNKNKNMWRITLMICHNRPSTQCCFLWMRSWASMLKMYNSRSPLKPIYLSGLLIKVCG